MFWTVVLSAQFLEMDTWQVYYLIGMGQIEAIKVAGTWRVLPEGVIEYDKQNPDRKNRRPGCDSYRGRGGDLFLGLSDNHLPNDLPERIGRLQGRRRRVVYRTFRNPKVLHQKNKSVTQLEFAF